MTRYEGKGEQKIAYLIIELFRSTLSDDSPLNPQINAMLHTANTISALGLPLHEKLIALAIIISLPPSYETLKTILTAAKSMELTVENVRSQVVIEEHRRTHAADSSGAFAARFKGGHKGKKPSMSQEERLAQRKAKGYCTHCRNHGHKTEECRRLKAQREKGNTMAHIATDSTVMCVQAQDDSDDVIRLFQVAENLSQRNDLTDRWLVDSGASRTMSSQRDWFQAYQLLTTPRKV